VFEKKRSQHQHEKGKVVLLYCTLLLLCIVQQYLRPSPPFIAYNIAQYFPTTPYPCPLTVRCVDGSQDGGWVRLPEWWS